MLDYCLFLSLIQNDFRSIKYYGNNFCYHPKVHDLLRAKNIIEKDNADIEIIYKESIQFIDYYWRHILSEDTKCLFIVFQTEEEAIISYKQMRSFGDTVILLGENPLIIFKNFKPNYKLLYRQEILIPNLNQDVDSFLNFQIEANDLSSTNVCFGDRESQLLQIFSNTSKYVYFGDVIDEAQLLKCLTLAKMKIFVIECFGVTCNRTVGFFVHRDFLEKTLIYHLTGYNKLINVYGFNEIMFKVPV